MNDPHLEALLDRYFDGTLDDAARAELERELLAGADSRERFWERAHLEEALRRCGREAWAGLPLFALPPHRPRRHRITWIALSAVAAGIAAGLFLWLRWDAPQEKTPGLIAGAPTGQDSILAPPSPEPSLEKRDPVAAVERTAFTRWHGRAWVRGNSLTGHETLRLDDGLIAFRFFGGVRMTVEGPAVFSPLSENSISLTQGFAQIEVPEVASGFVLKLGEAEVSSSEGRFEVRVDSGGRAELLVNRGRVIYRDPRTNTRLTLGDGQSLRTDAARGVISSSASPRPPQPSPPLGEQIADNGAKRLEEWRQASVRRDRDPDLLIHFRMDDPAEERGGLLINASPHLSASREAAVIAADWTEGRWPGKRALAFRNPSARARVAVQGSYPQVTFAAWVRIDDLRAYFNGLFFSEPTLRGETHWQLSSEAQFRFSVRPVQPLPGGIYLRGYTEKPVVDGGQRGVWRLLVTTYDSGPRTVIHYIDGREFARAQLAQSVDLRFGLATLGNCSVPPPDVWGQRSFGGVIDEFLLYSRVLTAEEIATLYREGRLD